MLIKVFYDVCFQLIASKDIAIQNTLHGATNFSEKSQLLSSKAHLFALNITESKSELRTKKMVNVGRVGCRQMSGYQGNKRPTFVRKHMLFILVSVFILHREV